MPRHKSSKSRVTVYRIIPSGPVGRHVQAKYADRAEFTTTEVDIGGIAGLLVYGHVSSSQARWASELAGLTGVNTSALGNQTAAGLLLLPIGEAIYAVCYGMGHLLLTYEAVDPGFGLRYAARTLNPDELRSVTRHTLDKRAQIDRRSLPSG